MRKVGGGEFEEISEFIVEVGEEEGLRYPILGVIGLIVEKSKGRIVLVNRRQVGSNMV